jgi:hypothetical protein
MSVQPKRSWILVAGIIGVTYAGIGILFALPAAHAKMWRLAAWVVSAAVYFAHICFERFRLRNSISVASLHVASASALGAFGLAVGANVHAMQIETSPRQRLLLMVSLALWPLMTGIAAYGVAVVTNWILKLKGRPVEVER